MKNSLPITVAGVLLSWFLCNAALAQREPTPFYVGASAGRTNAPQYCKDVAGNCDHMSSALKVFGGYQFTRHFGIEIGYTQTGKVSTGGTVSAASTSTRMRATDLVGVGTMNLTESLSAYGKLGGYLPTTETFTATAAGIRHDSNRRGGGTFGVGTALDLSRTIALRAEWQRYLQTGGAPVNTTDVDFFTLGFLYRF